MLHHGEKYVYSTPGLCNSVTYIVLYIYRGADCDTDHYLVVAKLGERLAVRKQAAQKFEGERFNLRKLNELEVKEKYQIEITNRFAALENLNVDEEVNRVWENIKKRISKPQLKRA